MIKPRSQPSHFKLQAQAEAQPWKDEGKFHAHSSDSFNPMNVGITIARLHQWGV